MRWKQLSCGGCFYFALQRESHFLIAVRRETFESTGILTIDSPLHPLRGSFPRWGTRDEIARKVYCRKCSSPSASLLSAAGCLHGFSFQYLRRFQIFMRRTFPSLPITPIPPTAPKQKLLFRPFPSFIKLLPQSYIFSLYNIIEIFCVFITKE